MAPEVILRQTEREEEEEQPTVASADQATRETSAKAAVHRQRYLDHLHRLAEQVWRDHCREDER